MLSVCIIAKNEEHIIENCLKSVISVSDEIIVLDTGSTDKTKEIASGFTNKVYSYAWTDDFSAARNECLKYATQPFILVLDADEKLINPHDIISTINDVKEEVGGWLIKIISYKEHNNTKDLYKNKLVRLFRNNLHFKYEGIIHEQIVNTIISSGFKIEDSKIEILHEGYNYEPSVMKKKQLRNLNLLLKQDFPDSKNAYNQFQIAKTYLALKDLDNAENYAKKSIDNSQSNNVLKPQALNYGSIIAYQKGNKEIALSRALESLNCLVNQKFANYVAGECYYDFNNDKLALIHYTNMLNIEQNNNLMSEIVGDYELPLSQIYFRIGRSLFRQKRIDDAIKNLKLGLLNNPKDINCLTTLANCYYHSNKKSDAYNTLLEAKKYYSDNKELDKHLKFLESQLGDLIMSDKINSYQEKLISLSMIVKNEETMLRECLESVKNLVDEIIIVDTGSTDSTKEIAKGYSSKVFDFKWIDDFAAARNFALSKSTSKWILYLDADERINNLKADEFRESLSKLEDNVGGIICIIESKHKNLTGKDSDIHRGAYPRIFRNLYPNIKFTGRVHEQISPSIKEQGLTLTNSKILIEHLGYNQSRPIMENKIKRNYTMLLKHVQEEPTNGYAWYQLGQTLGHMRLTKQAEDTIKFAIKCGNLSPIIEASAKASLAQFCGNDKRFEESYKWAKESIDLVPNSLYSMNLAAYSLLHLGKFSEAEKLFERTLELKSKFYEAMPQSGFDIDIPIEIIESGLEKAKMKIIPKS